MRDAVYTGTVDIHKKNPLTQIMITDFGETDIGKHSLLFNVLLSDFDTVPACDEMFGLLPFSGVYIFAAYPIRPIKCKY